MNNDPPLHRFEEFGSLSTTERAAVVGLADAPFVVEKGRNIRREGVPTDGFFLLLEGWAAASHLLPDGSRQIMKIHLPGDALGTPSMAMAHTTEELVAITDVVVAKISLIRFGALFDSHPRIIARFMLSVQLERVALMDRLVAVGRTSAIARVAGLLLDLRDRLAIIGHVQHEGFELLLTQEQIGDVLGLTAVHVNRVMRSLSEKGFIERSARHIRLVDQTTLRTLAAKPNRRPLPDQAWLPTARDVCV